MALQQPVALVQQPSLPGPPGNTGSGGPPGPRGPEGPKGGDRGTNLTSGAQGPLGGQNGDYYLRTPGPDQGGQCTLYMNLSGNWTIVAKWANI